MGKPVKLGAPYEKQDGSLGAIYPGDLVRSVTTNTVYKIDIKGRKILLDNQKGKVSEMSMAGFVQNLNIGRIVPANGLDRAVERSKKGR